MEEEDFKAFDRVNKTSLDAGHMAITCYANIKLGVTCINSLEGKRIIVTGAGSGIGSSTVLRLLEEGAHVVGGDLDASGLSRTKALANNHPNLTCVEFDLGNEASIRNLVAHANAELGGLDGLANIAADVSTSTMNKDVEVADMDPELWSHVLRVNLIGSGILVRETVPLIGHAGGGSVVLISSAGAWLGETVFPAYQASKIGIHALARHTARAWGKKGIRCNVIAPGMVLTEASAKVITQDYKDGMLARICSARLGQPRDLAAAISFLLSDDASWITAQVWSVDGGLMLRE